MTQDRTRLRAEALSDHLRRTHDRDVVWDALQVGEAYPETILGGKADCVADRDHRICFRDAGHPGRHVTLDLFKVVDVWPPTLSPKDT
jgi:hypothetical protein